MLSEIDERIDALDGVLRPARDLWHGFKTRRACERTVRPAEMLVVRSQASAPDSPPTVTPSAVVVAKFAPRTRDHSNCSHCASAFKSAAADRCSADQRRGYAATRCAARRLPPRSPRGQRVLERPRCPLSRRHSPRASAQLTVDRLCCRSNMLYQSRTVPMPFSRKTLRREDDVARVQMKDCQTDASRRRRGGCVAKQVTSALNLLEQRGQRRTLERRRRHRR